MSNRGPKPAPAGLKLLRATRERTKPAAPAPPPAVPECPAHLDDTARAEWARIVPLLGRSQALSAADGAALALYCDAFSTWVQALAEIRTHGLLVETDLGALKANPAAAIACRARAECLRVLAEFGLTPASRSRVRSAAPDAPKDELEEFLSGKG